MVCQGNSGEEEFRMRKKMYRDDYGFRPSLRSLSPHPSAAAVAVPVT
jgi:hypothetical protein